MRTDLPLFAIANAVLGRIWDYMIFLTPKYENKQADRTMCLNMLSFYASFTNLATWKCCCLRERHRMLDVSVINGMETRYGLHILPKGDALCFVIVGGITSPRKSIRSRLCFVAVRRYAPRFTNVHSLKFEWKDMNLQPGCRSCTRSNLTHHSVITR